MPKTAIVMLHHEPRNEHYLHLALESIRRQDVEKEVIVVDSSDTPKNYPSWVKPLYVDHSTNSAVAANLGVKECTDSKYLMFCNDDVVFGANSIHEQVMVMEMFDEKGVILNAWSNCDVGFHHHSHVIISGKYYPRQFPIEDITDADKEFMMNESPKGRHLLIPVPWLCFYATMMPLALWRKMGGLDEKFASGPDDRDFCMRAAKEYKVGCVLNMRPTIWHFSGQTIAKKNQEAANANRLVNSKYFQEKWGIPQ